MWALATLGFEAGRELCEKLLNQEEKILMTRSILCSGQPGGQRGHAEAPLLGTPGRLLGHKMEMTEKVKILFDENGIEIPFNQVDVNIRRKERDKGKKKTGSAGIPERAVFRWPPEGGCGAFRHLSGVSKLVFLKKYKFTKINTGKKNPENTEPIDSLCNCCISKL